MITVKKQVDKLLQWIIVIIFILLVIDVVWQVASRYILNDPSSITDELARYLMIWLAFLGASYVTGLNLHLNIDILPSRLQGNHKRILNHGIQILIFFFSFAVLILGGVRLVYITITLEQLAPSLEIPLGYIYLVIPVSGMVICFYSIYFLTSKTDSL